MSVKTFITNNPALEKDDDVYYPRKFDETLLAWRKSARRIPLVIKGLRQSGKTKCILHFGKAEYESLLYVDFRNHPEYASIFATYDVNDIKERLSLEFGFTHFIEGKTLLVFDEIQDCPIARGSLKNFYLDGRYDVICSGSILGVSGYSEEMEQYIAVGYENVLPFYPMDFEEFLWASGLNKEYTDRFRQNIKEFRKVDDFTHQRLLQYFRVYMVVGGLPSVVRNYLENHDFVKVRESQRGLIASYRDDFATHLKSDGASVVKSIERAKISAVLDSMPAQLSRENTTKFSYNLLNDSHAKGQKYASAIQWLIDYGLLVRCRCLSQIDTVQEGYASTNKYKLYFADSGLFCAMLDPSIARSIILDSFGDYKGGIYENIVADAFAKAGRSLYYYAIDAEHEIDFITRYGEKVALTEVKAKRGKTKTADAVLAELDQEKYCIVRLSASNIGKVENKITLPYYLSSFLPPDSGVLEDIEGTALDVDALLGKTKE